jgi:WhiB family redox-sensing transcriptional regulator
MSEEYEEPGWDWRLEGRCNPESGATLPGGLPIDPFIFYPERKVIVEDADGTLVEDTEVWEVDEDGNDTPPVVLARQVCSFCPVRNECLDFALGTRETEGIWAGLTYNERKGIMRRARKTGEQIPRYKIPPLRTIT